MIARNIITAIVLFLILSMGLLYGIPEVIPDEMLEAYTGFFTPTLVYTVSCILSVGYLVLQYRSRLTPMEIQAKKQEFYYNLFTDEQKQTFDTMSEEDQKRFIQVCETNYFQDKRSEIHNKVYDWTYGTVPKGLKPVRWVMICLMILSVGYVGIEGYQQISPSLDSYIANATKTLDDQTLYIEGLPPIVLVGDGTIRQSEVDMFVEKFKKLPENVKNAHGVFYLYSPDRFKEVKVASHGSDSKYDYVDGYADGGDMSSKFSIVCRQSIIAHEASHIFDIAYGSSSTQEFQNLYHSYRGTFEFPGVEQGYCNNDVKEFFAESGKLYIDSPDYLKDVCEPLYNYFARLYV